MGAALERFVKFVSRVASLRIPDSKTCAGYCSLKRVPVSDTPVFKCDCWQDKKYVFNSQGDAQVSKQQSLSSKLKL